MMENNEWVVDPGYQEMKKEMIWHGKESPASTSYRFNRELEFKYWGAYKKNKLVIL